MEVGFRQSFDAADQVCGRYRGLLHPIELALPFTWDMYSKIRPSIGKIAEEIASYGARVLSVHAVQAPISDDRFLVWGTEVANFAKTVGCKYITVHPNKGFRDRKEIAINNIRYLSNTWGVVFCVETFESRSRVLSIQEIMDESLPMVLDTSHVSSFDRTMRILAQYKDNIPTIHMSTSDGVVSHQRINEDSLNIVRYLRDTGWCGSIVLEYMREFHEFFNEDIERIKGVLYE
jgi:sugar phosphate isomerase/epimerase